MIDPVPIPVSADLHIHTRHSHDAQGSLSECCEAAISAGLGVIGFTEHVDFDPADPGIGFFNYDAVRSAIDEVRRAYTGQIRIFFGVEVDYQEWFTDQIEDFLAHHPFDYVIGSVHAIGQQALMTDAYLAERDPFQAVSDYFEAVARSAESGLFDVIGHLEYKLSRRGHIRDRLENGAYETALARCVQRIVRSGSILEINTAGGRHTDDSIYPGAIALGLYRRFGGIAVCLGSDAHSPERVGWRLVDAAASADHAGLIVISDPGRRSSALSAPRRRASAS